MCVPFHVVNIFDDFDDQVDVFNELFPDSLSKYAPIKRIKIKLFTNPFILPEIKQLMKTRGSWEKRCVKQTTNSTRTLFDFFRQEVKQEMRIAEI